MFEGCPRCRSGDFASNLTVTYDYDGLVGNSNMGAFKLRRHLWQYSDILPVKSVSSIVDLGAGGTPLLNCKSIASSLLMNTVLLKDETRNPTGSFKDRLCSVAISKGIEFGATTVTAMTTGNHGAATAAHASRAGLRSVLFTLDYVPSTMLYLMQIYGANVIRLKSQEFGAYPYSVMHECIKNYGWYPTNSYTIPPTGNPYGVEGYKTIAYEILQQLQWNCPDFVVVPTGHGDGLYGIWKGFNEMKTLGLVERTPKMVAVQPKNAAPLVNALETNLTKVVAVETKPTVAFSIAGDYTTFQGLRAIRDSNGFAVAVEDQNILNLQRETAKSEGLFFETASIASLSGVKALRESGEIDRTDSVVCIMTSGGLKNTTICNTNLPEPSTIESNFAEFERYAKEIGLELGSKSV
jgi:threonine synthase